MGRVLTGSRYGLVVEGGVSVATGTSERDGARGMVEARPGRHRITPGAGKHFDTRRVVVGM